jgi:hypothetical protein
MRNAIAAIVGFNKSQQCRHHPPIHRMLCDAHNSLNFLKNTIAAIAFCFIANVYYF